jgi:hypothetical protein
MREWAEELVARAREDGVALTGEGGLLTDLMRHVLQTGLEVEMAEHLGYERGQAPPGGLGNARNGGYDKTVRPRSEGSTYGSRATVGGHSSRRWCRSTSAASMACRAT